MLEERMESSRSAPKSRQIPAAEYLVVIVSSHLGTITMTVPSYEISAPSLSDCGAVSQLSAVAAPCPVTCNHSFKSTIGLQH